ncbi:MAG: transporter [Deltaproteobacteria bacterium]|nr:MAG: transporter [Deltaproteobacteria bacterium]
MRRRLFRLYRQYLLRHPVAVLACTLLLVVLVGSQANHFRLDASADSLVLEGDRDLATYRELRRRYSSDDFLVVAVTPMEPLFSDKGLQAIRELRDDLASLEEVRSVTSILDVPLLQSPPIGFAELQHGAPTLLDPNVDRAMARREFLTSPLYRELILSQDARTTALQVNLKPDPKYDRLLQRRNELAAADRRGELGPEEQKELERVRAEFKAYSAEVIDREARTIARVRAVLDRHREAADIHLGGVSMIVADMIDFIRHDLLTFGIGVLVFLVGMLALIFRQLRWVVLPMLCCGCSVWFMFGLLGWLDWRVTVVSSNFTSLLLIITLSLAVHLIVRYHELHAVNPRARQQTLVQETVRSKFLPSLFTTLTTQVAFVSLLISGIRPVIDFGWMMAIGTCAAFVLSFLLFPAGLALLKPKHFQPRFDITGHLTGLCADLITRRGRLVLLAFAGLALFSLIGMSRLTVENRFIDNFKKETEIYRGMALIDRKLGGTTPMEIILKAPADWQPTVAEDADFDDEFADDPFAEEGHDAGMTATSYWYNSRQLQRLAQIHTWLEQLPATGKVMSLATTMKLVRQLNDGMEPDDLLLSVLHRKLPADIDHTLFAPYMNADGSEARITLRIVDSDPTLKRNALLDEIRTGLTEHFGLAPEQVTINGMFVLYNNVLQSLYRSQILTLGFVFAVIMVMFLLLFRSVRLALIAIIPNLTAAGVVLGLMGWLGIPLDIMTITIAAITIGIAVDDTIHYVHRFTEEVTADLDYQAAVRRCHSSVGRAMYYTSVIVIVGFGILAFSDFMPTIYFGLFTGLAMAVAMIANLTLLALLLMTLKPKDVCWLPGYQPKTTRFFDQPLRLWRRD